MLLGMMSDPTSPPPSNVPRGLLIVITGASGVGKGTLREKWLAGQDVFYSTSWTTREPREGEMNGREYVFVTPQEFLDKARQDGFLEHAQFVGNHYGTPIEPIEEALARGQDVVLEIEVEGAMQVQERLGDEAILVFIMPPSLTELRRRLTGRATETPERIEKRLTRAVGEIREAHKFRYVVVNDDLERAAQEMLAVQHAERAARKAPEQWSPEDHAASQAAQRVHSRNLSSADLEQVVNS
ncbi:guanylate kinase [Deinococcus cavernae]|uniref:Guanylate kinase n=2 Tax=Deinococcus cavernae TaxID=2320857 RepID=A0A418V827_9DEIO|nr:guanylate kinase [Deinococcus cavernae]RJF72240.1 guanylate kinase [Deinococcus cavernae]